jgi:hypothetical protein
VGEVPPRPPDRARSATADALDRWIGAIQRDVRALAAPEILDALAGWRAALVGPEGPARESARAALARIGRALAGPSDEVEITDARVPVVAHAGAPELTEALDLRRRADEDADDDDDDATGEAALGVRSRSVAGGVVPEGGFDELPTHASPVDPLLAELVRGRADAPLPRSREREARPEGPPTDDPLVRVEGLRRGSPHLPRGTRGPAEPPRPRASLIVVRALHQAIAPLCRELVPLEPERRVRRFWSLWREVSGERGIRREAAEQLLRRATDVRELAADLIAEVQGVDRDSVLRILERLDAEAEPPRPAPTDERAHAALVGAPVKLAELPDPDVD